MKLVQGNGLILSIVHSNYSYRSWYILQKYILELGIGTNKYVCIANNNGWCILVNRCNINARKYYKQNKYSSPSFQFDSFVKLNKFVD